MINSNAINILRELEAMAFAARARAAELGVSINVDFSIHDHCQASDDVAALVAGAQALGWAKKSEWDGGGLSWYSSPVFEATIIIYNKEN